ncbi:hypothetical protein [Methylocystis sp. S23]
MRQLAMRADVAGFIGAAPLCDAMRYPPYQAGADGGMKVTRFLFENSKLVRTVERESESWFAAKDVCDARGRAKAALRKLDEDEK